jgi:hypothetical protein
MLYWLGVYFFVVLAVLLPFVLLYLMMVLSWLGLAAIRFATTLRMASMAKKFSHTGYRRRPALAGGAERSSAF